MDWLDVKDGLDTAREFVLEYYRYFLVGVGGVLLGAWLF